MSSARKLARRYISKDLGGEPAADKHIKLRTVIRAFLDAGLREDAWDLAALCSAAVPGDKSGSGINAAYLLGDAEARCMAETRGVQDGGKGKGLGDGEGDEVEGGVDQGAASDGVGRATT